MKRIYKSRITLETWNPATGALCQYATAHNFASQATIRHMQWVQRALYRYGLADLGGTDDDDIEPYNPSSHILLTDSALTADPTNEYIFPGQILGWASKDTYAGSDTLRGTPDTTQLDAEPTLTKWVFNWPTNAANGTIRSVGFGGLVIADSTLTLQHGSIEQIWDTPSYWNYFAQASAAQAFAQTSGTNISVLDGTYSQTTTFSVSAQFSAITGLAWDRTNSFLWVIGTSGSNKAIAAYNAAGVLQTGPFTLTNRAYTYLAHDGTNLWSAVTTSGANTITLYRLNTTNGGDMTNFTTPVPTTDSDYKISGLAYDPAYQRLWAKVVTKTYVNYTTFARSFIRSFDISGNSQTVDVSLNTTDLTGTGISYLSGTSDKDGTFRQQDFDVIDGYNFAMPTNWGNVNRVAKFRPDGLGTRALLDTPVVKDNTQTLKLIYTINYV